MRTVLILVSIAIAIRLVLYLWGTKGRRTISRGMRTITAINAVMAAYREGDYETGLQRAESLRDPFGSTSAALRKL